MSVDESDSGTNVMLQAQPKKMTATKKGVHNYE
jgi:hypothetical protein